VCDRPARFEDAHDRRLIRSNVPDFRHLRFTVWRCDNCGSLHSLEPIDFERFYRNYLWHEPLQGFVANVLLKSRLKTLVKAGLTRDHAVLDEGCGSGAFVRFLIDNGYHRAAGFDPYSASYGDRAVLRTQYDYVTSQDVVEHVVDVRAELEQLSRMTRAGGFVVIGTPDATEISLDSPLDETGRLHQPFHRHILTRTQLARLVEGAGFVDVRVLRQSYVDTWVPFCNWQFVNRFWLAAGGMVARGEDWPPRAFVSNPSLIFWGLFGRLFPRPKDTLIIARKAEASPV
jgi:2-polyprenyl-3-methyl-5-hydroxy-6-metoxy-1,4-benzoquinol methylase